MWEAKEENNGVTVIDFNGTEVVFDDSVNASNINDLARDAGVVRFEVKGEDGSQLNAEDFPVTEGTIYLSEYNEAKAWDVEDPEVEPASKIYMPDGSTENIYGEVDTELINELALEAGLVRFEVKDENGNQLNQTDFPVSGTEIYISEYNEAKYISVCVDVWIA